MMLIEQSVCNHVIYMPQMVGNPYGLLNSSHLSIISSATLSYFSTIRVDIMYISCIINHHHNKIYCIVMLLIDGA